MCVYIGQHTHTTTPPPRKTQTPHTHTPHTPTTPPAQERKAAEEAKKKEMQDLLIASIVQPKVPVGVDPKSIVCEFFRHNACTKGFKCKFAHNLAVERKGPKIDVYSDRRADGENQGEGGKEGMDDWDQEKLEAVVKQKHGSEKQANNETQIICKYFLEAVEKKLYGWFWYVWCMVGGGGGFGMGGWMRVLERGCVCDDCDVMIVTAHVCLHGAYTSTTTRGMCMCTLLPSTYTNGTHPCPYIPCSPHNHTCIHIHTPSPPQSPQRQCPNGKECKYRHALPPGYVLKSQIKELLEEEAANRRDVAEVIEEERAKVDAKTPITQEVCFWGGE